MDDAISWRSFHPTHYGRNVGGWNEMIWMDFSISKCALEHPQMGGYCHVQGWDFLAQSKKRPSTIVDTWHHDFMHRAFYKFSTKKRSKLSRGGAIIQRATRGGAIITKSNLCNCICAWRYKVSKNNQSTCKAHHI
jgi:hypothetical protein